LVEQRLSNRIGQAADAGWRLQWNVGVEGVEILILQHQFERRAVEAGFDGLGQVRDGDAALDLREEALRSPARPFTISCVFRLRSSTGSWKLDEHDAEAGLTRVRRRPVPRSLR
jgi:hypothetical protein